MFVKTLLLAAAAVVGTVVSAQEPDSSPDGTPPPLPGVGHFKKLGAGPCITPTNAGPDLVFPGVNDMNSCKFICYTFWAGSKNTCAGFWFQPKYQVCNLYLTTNPNYKNRDKLYPSDLKAGTEGGNCFSSLAPPTQLETSANLRASVQMALLAGAEASAEASAGQKPIDSYFNTKQGPCSESSDASISAINPALEGEQYFVPQILIPSTCQSICLYSKLVDTETVCFTAETQENRACRLTFNKKSNAPKTSIAGSFIICSRNKNPGKGANALNNFATGGSNTN